MQLQDDPRFLAGTNTIDEYCAFEILDSKSLGAASGVGSGSSSSGPAAPDTWGERAYVRNVWKDGIQYVVVAAGGGTAIGGGLPTSDSLIAFKLGTTSTP